METAVQILKNAGLFAQVRADKSSIWGAAGKVTETAPGEFDYSKTTDWFQIQKKDGFWFGWFFFGQTSVVMKSAMDIDVVATAIVDLFAMSSIALISVGDIIKALFLLQDQFLVAEIASETRISAHSCNTSSSDMAPYYVAIHKSDFIDHARTFSIFNNDHKWFVSIENNSEQLNSVQARDLDDAVEIITGLNRR